jgi:hypothetical protein
MIYEDYILRMIRQFAQMLARTLRRIAAKQYSEALAEMDEAARQLLGVDLDTVMRLPHGQLTTLLALGREAAVSDRFAVLATLLQQAGVVHAAEDRFAQSREAFLKALHLVLAAWASRQGSALPDFTPAVGDLVAALKQNGLPLETNAALLGYYEQIGEFAKAEDALFEMLDGEPANADIIELGRGFYERLEQQSDTALAAGNLPRDEVAAGLAELQTRRGAR